MSFEEQNPNESASASDQSIGRRRFLQGAAATATAAAPIGLNVLAGAAAWTLHHHRPPGTVSELFPSTNEHVREAQFWRPSCAGVQCTLCPFDCFLPVGARGKCKVRMNVGGRLVTLVYGHPVAVHLDPIEKKPVYHLLPGSRIYSLATVGCNLKCTFCQNWEISQTYPEQATRETVVPKSLEIFRDGYGGLRGRVQHEQAKVLSPAEIVEAAQRTRCQSVAYTYSEPTIFYEYLLETAKLAKAKGLRNVMVSCGYINPEPLRQMAPYFDVIKIDLKGFDESFYRRVVGGELKFVLRTLVELKKLGVMTEIVNLIVPTLNDSPKTIRSMCEWIMENLGPDVPIFFSRFSPNYQMQNIPSTPLEALEEARNTAMEIGLHYVYTGNVPGHPGGNTYCPTCKRVLIRRHGYAQPEILFNLDKCPYDGTKIPGVWH
ncbi:MAG: AmmeMemoRadiSam system radical SAM enzyme [Planctomycetota bacterium]|nr:AmmeMemoRadiSam system radical SAM enzyme [Planctomycetota bacterium]